MFDLSLRNHLIQLLTETIYTYGYIHNHVYILHQSESEPGDYEQS